MQSQSTQPTSQVSSSVQQEKEHSLVRIAVWVSLIGNILFFVVSYWVGYISQSLALKADAWHTLSDSLSTLVVMVGLFLARRPADKDHPFGHGRYELIASMIVGMMLIGVGYFFSKEGVENLIHHQAANFGMAAIILTVIKIIFKEGLAQVSFRAARIANRPSLAADGWHHRSDALSSVIVLVGIFLGPWFWWIDGVLSCLVGVIIIFLGYTVVRDASSSLLEERLPDALYEQVLHLIKEQYPERNLYPHEFRWHNYIQQQYLTFHIVLPPAMNVKEASGITSALEQSLQETTGLHSTIYIEPQRPEVYADAPVTNTLSHESVT